MPFVIKKFKAQDQDKWIKTKIKTRLFRIRVAKFVFSIMNHIPLTFVPFSYKNNPVKL